MEEVRGRWQQGHSELASLVLVKVGSSYFTFDQDAKILESLNLTMKFEKNPLHEPTVFRFHADVFNVVLEALWKSSHSVLVK